MGRNKKWLRLAKKIKGEPWHYYCNDCKYCGECMGKANWNGCVPKAGVKLLGSMIRKNNIKYNEAKKRNAIKKKFGGK